MADLKGTKTEANLAAAFAGESQAHAKYQYFASKAKKEGYVQIHDIFMETSKNEKEHAKIWFKLLHDGEVPDTIANLNAAADGENEEWTAMYKEFAETAREEGFDEIAGETVFKKEEEIEWKCINCGHIIKGTDAPVICPVCKHPQSYFEERATNFK